MKQLVIFKRFGAKDNVLFRAEYDTEQHMPRQGETLRWQSTGVLFDVVEVQHQLDFQDDSLVTNEPTAKVGAIIVFLKEV